MKRKLVKYTPRAYSELIRSDLPRSSGARPARLPFLRSSPLSVMKHPVPKSSSPSVSEPLTAKPTRGELRSRLEVLAKKKSSVKRKPSSSPEGYPPARGKTLKVGAYPSPSSAVEAGDSSGGGGGGGGLNPPWRFSLSRSRVHVVGCRSPSYNAGRGDGESRSP